MLAPLWIFGITPKLSKMPTWLTFCQFVTINAQPAFRSSVKWAHFLCPLLRLTLWDQSPSWMTQALAANSDFILSHIETDKDKCEADSERGDRDIDVEAERQCPTPKVTGNTGLTGQIKPNKNISFCYHSLFHSSPFSLCLFPHVCLSCVSFQLLCQHTNVITLKQFA